MHNKKYIQNFNEHQENPYPFNVSGAPNLVRGVRIDKLEYVDDPKLRKISTGESKEIRYVSFLKNYKKLGIQDPTKSIHCILNPKQKKKEEIEHSYGNIYRVFTTKDTTFSFCTHLRNGGLGSTFWFPERFDVKSDSISRELFYDLYGKNIDEFSFYPEYGTISRELFYDLYDKNIDKFFEIITDYQKKLIEKGVVGNITYNELLELPEDLTLQLWTESPVLHKRAEHYEMW
jgi:hypothetical protein